MSKNLQHNMCIMHSWFYMQLAFKYFHLS